MSDELVTRTLTADQTTPVRAYAALRARSPGQSSFLLESVVPGERWGRYSILGYRCADELVYASGEHAIARLAGDVGWTGASANLARPRDPGIARQFASALVGYIGYDTVHALHRVPSWPEQTEVARMMRGSTIVVFDNLEQTLTIAARARDDVDRCVAEIHDAAALAPFEPPDPGALPDDVETTMDDASYAKNVERAQEYIRAGDVFQVVLARTFLTRRRGADPFDVYRALRVLSPSPYLYFLDFAKTPNADAMAIAGASPETMVKLEGDRITLRPIAGTRRRGRTEEEDRALADELLADPKERAEHVMLIDLARNDAGRVATTGTVEVVRQMEIERYSHVMHIVSEVTAKKRPDASPVDVLRAAFPAGTLTGAPKVRATQIIRELETRARGVYGGAIGYLTASGNVDLAIAIRTVVCRGDSLEVTAGAGIVEGSDPHLEAFETRNKARAALAAIRAARRT